MIIISVKLTIEYVGMNYELLFCMSWEQLLCFFFEIFTARETPAVVRYIKYKEQEAIVMLINKITVFFRWDFFHI
jgi:hypothetical protein